MNAETMSATVEVFPFAYEVAIVKLPVGATARVHHPAGLREYVPSLPIPYFAVVPGDREAIGWDAVPCWYSSLTGVRNSHHRLDRRAWHDAARLLARADVVYVRYEVRDYYGKPRWTAVRAEVREVARPVEAVAS